MVLTPEQFNILVTKEELAFSLEKLQNALPTREQTEQSLQNDDIIIQKLDVVNAEIAAMHGNYQRLDGEIEQIKKQLQLNTSKA